MIRRARWVCIRTGKRQYRVFERLGGGELGLVKTYWSADRARLCIYRLETGRELAPHLKRARQPLSPIFIPVDVTLAAMARDIIGLRR